VLQSAARSASKKAVHVNSKDSGNAEPKGVWCVIQEGKWKEKKRRESGELTEEGLSRRQRDKDKGSYCTRRLRKDPSLQTNTSVLLAQLIQRVECVTEARSTSLF